MARLGVGVWCAGRLEPSSGRRLGAGILRGSGPICFDEEPRHKEREAMALEEQVLAGNGAVLVGCVRAVGDAARLGIVPEFGSGG